MPDLVVLLLDISESIEKALARLDSADLGGLLGCPRSMIRDGWYSSAGDKTDELGYHLD